MARRREAVEIVKDVQGREVLTAHAPILPLRWLMFVELPIEEAYAPLYDVDQAVGPAADSPA